MQVTNESLRDLLDRDAIREVMVRYAAGIDRRDARMIAECFAPDVHAVYAGIDYGHGAETVTKNLIGLLTWKHSTHFIGNQYVTLDGDRATMETYAVAYVLSEEQGRDRLMVRGLRYQDSLVRTDGRWVIERREHFCDWMFEPQAIPPSAKVSFSERSLPAD